MAKSDIFNINPRTSKGPRNAFDIGYCTLFTSPCGMLLPSYVEDVKAGDKLVIDVNCITRTRPVNTAAFMSFDQKVDFWFVPYRLLWSAYPQWRLSQSYPRSSVDLQDVQGQAYLPTSTWTSIYDCLSSDNMLQPEISFDSFATPNTPDALRLLDLLGYGAPGHSAYSLLKRGISKPAEDENWTLLDPVIQDMYSSFDYGGLPLNYFRLAAFQCIYMSSYRNEEYEKLDPTYYNMDSLFILDPSTPPYSTVGGSSTASGPTFLSAKRDDRSISWPKLFTPRYKNWRKDLFTALKPESGLYNFLGSAPSPGIDHGSFGTSFDWPLPNYDADSQSTNTTSNESRWQGKMALPSQELYQKDSKTYLFAQNIRNLMAQDKFSRLMIYADKDYSSQMKALFGVEVDEPNVPRYLGSFSNDVSISDVTATSAGSDGDGANASTSVLGQLAGKGYGSRNGHCFESDFKEDGIVMGIHYIMPRNNYDSYRVNKFNSKASRWDYYAPEFDGLGLAPTFCCERGYQSHFGSSVYNVTNILGYSPRYYEYKTRQNETHGSFMTGQADYNWTLSNNQFGIVVGSQFSNYKIHPKITDRIFTVAYDGSQATDPFQCFFQYGVTRVSNLETFGIPSF